MLGRRVDVAGPAGRYRARILAMERAGLLVLPGPGLLLTAGLALLVTEFAWAQRWLTRLRGHAKRVVQRVRPAMPSA